MPIFILKGYLEKDLRDDLFNILVVRITAQRGEVILLRFYQLVAELEPEPGFLTELLCLPLPLRVWDSHPMKMLRCYKMLMDYTYYKGEFLHPKITQ